jgi:hypothetical protein
VGDAGLASLANALERGALPRLSALKLQCNNFGATGSAALGACVGSGALTLTLALALALALTQALALPWP